MDTLQTLDRLLDPIGRSFGVKSPAAIVKLRVDSDMQIGKPTFPGTALSR